MMRLFCCLENRQNVRARLAFDARLAKLLATLCVCLTTTSPASAQANRVARTASTALNLLEVHEKEYARPKEPTLIDIGKAQYLAIDGKEAPDGPGLVKSIGTIYGVAYGLKMMSKQQGRDYMVPPLEALWWGNKGEYTFLDEPRETWNWKLLIRTPDFITDAQLRAVGGAASSRGNGTPKGTVHLETITEGSCVQVLHKGPYADEPATIAAMGAFAKEHGMVRNGYHHEIYLTDPNRTAPEDMRTILRQPVKPK